MEATYLVWALAATVLSLFSLAGAVSSTLVVLVHEKSIATEKFDNVNFVGLEFSLKDGSPDWKLEETTACRLHFDGNPDSGGRRLENFANKTPFPLPCGNLVVKHFTGSGGDTIIVVRNDSSSRDVVDEETSTHSIWFEDHEYEIQLPPSDVDQLTRGVTHKEIFALYDVCQCANNVDETTLTGLTDAILHPLFQSTASCKLIEAMADSWPKTVGQSHVGQSDVSEICHREKYEKRYKVKFEQNGDRIKTKAYVEEPTFPCEEVAILMDELSTSHIEEFVGGQKARGRPGLKQYREREDKTQESFLSELHQCLLEGPTSVESEGTVTFSCNVRHQIINRYTIDQWSAFNYSHFEPESCSKFTIVKNTGVEVMDGEGANVGDNSVKELVIVHVYQPKYQPKFQADDEGTNMTNKKQLKRKRRSSSKTRGSKRRVAPPAKRSRRH